MNNFYKTLKFNKLLKPLVLVIFLLALISNINAQSSYSPYCDGDIISLFAPTSGPDGFGNTIDYTTYPGTVYYSWSDANYTWSSTDKDPMINPNVPADLPGYHGGVFYLSISLGSLTVFNGYTVVVLVPPILPRTLTVENGGYKCNSTNGVQVKVLGSQNSVRYFLVHQNGLASDTIGPFIGNGSDLNLGTVRTITGTYKAYGQRPGTLCFKDMLNTITIYEPTYEVNATVVAHNVSCNGQTNGYFSLTPSGGFGTYEYNYNNTGWVSQSNSPNLPAVTGYDIKIRDAAHTNCVVDLNNFSISQPATLTANIDINSIVGVDCNGNSTGHATVVAGGGTSTYSYLWDNGETVADATHLNYGTHSVTVTDAHGCSVSTTVPIGQPDVLTATIDINSIRGVDCHGNSTGHATVVAGGGTASFGYLWDNGETVANATHLNYGNHTVTITDAHGCSATTNVPISQPDVLTSAITSYSNVECFGALQGEAFVEGYGGTLPYSYNWTGGTGSASSHVTGLAGAYSIGITYNVTVTDNNGCTSQSSVIIYQPQVGLSADVATTNISCTGLTDGRIFISNPQGGYGTYEYSIQGGAVNTWSGVFDYNTLDVGTYAVMIRDAAHTSCTMSLGSPISIQAPPAALSAIVDTVHISCHGGTGEIIIHPSGGWGTYDFKVNGANWVTSFSNPYIESGLSMGSYQVEIRDHEFPTCILNKGSYTINEPAILQANVTSTKDITCFGAHNGEITIGNVSGAWGTYQYTINGGTDWYSLPTNPYTITGLYANSYDVRLRDAQDPNCSINLGSHTILEPATIVAFAEVMPLPSGSEVSCPGSTDGGVKINYISGGTGTIFTYHLINTNPPYNSYTNNDGDFYTVGLLGAGAYHWYVTDVNGCQFSYATGDLTIHDPITIQPVATVEAPYNGKELSCYNTSDGIINLHATGGTGSLDYILADNSNIYTIDGSNNFTGLAAGTYTWTVSDANSCIISGTLTVHAPAQVIPSSNVTSNFNGAQIKCNGFNDGQITLHATGGVTPYTYTLDGNTLPANGNVFNNLYAGNHDYIVTDANGCISNQGSQIITEPDHLYAYSAATLPILCNGITTTDIPIYIYGGTHDYYIDGQYALNNSTNTDPNTQIADYFSVPVETDYNIIITDANGCMDSVYGIIYVPTAIQAHAFDLGEIYCFGGTTTVKLTASGANPPYTDDGGLTYWTSDTVQRVVSYNAAGTTFTIEDNNGCPTQVTVNPPQPDIISATVSHTNVVCNGGHNGTITVHNPTGGYTGSYQFSFDGGVNWQLLPTIDLLAPGTYDVRIRDAVHTTCEINIGNVIITQPDLVVLTAHNTNVSCNGANDGTITASATGTGTVTITVNGSTYIPNHHYTPGDYTVVASYADGNGIGVCTDTKVLHITQPDPVVLTATKTNVSCNGAADGTITASATGTGTITITVNGNLYNASATYAPGIYTVVATAADGNGIGVCTDTKILQIDQPNPVLLTATSTNVTCNGAADGTITASATGTGTVSITVNGSTYNPTAHYIPGYYTVVATAANGNNNGVCTDTKVLHITQPDAVVLTATSTNVSCNGLGNGTITASATGTGIIAITVNGSTYNPSAHYVPGYYTVVATAFDGNGIGTCTDTKVLHITQPDPVVLTATSTNVSCNGLANGTITASATGTGIVTITVNGLTYNPSTLYAPGFYTVVASTLDGNGVSVCTDTKILHITQPDPVVLTATNTNVSCNGLTDATITASATGTGILTITVNGNQYNANTLYPAGYYTVVATAVNGNNNGTCTDTKVLHITEPTALTLSAIKTNVTCNGLADGTISVTTNGTYIIKNSSNVTVTGPHFGPDTYTIHAQKADGNNIGVCTQTTSVTITEPSLLTLSATRTNVTCNGSANGTITVTTNGSYIIKNSSNVTVTGSNFGPDTYTIIASKVGGNSGDICTTSTTVTITQPNALSANISQQNNISCYGYTDGSFTIVGTGGTAPYLYKLGTNTSFTSVNTLGSLLSGVYNVDVKDANSCIYSLQVTITEPQAWVPVIVEIGNTPSHTACQNSTGNTYTVSNGHTGSTYQWIVNGGIVTNGANTQTVTITWGTGTLGTLKVKETLTNGCINTDVNTIAYNVTLNAIPTPVISGLSTVLASQLNVVYSTTFNANHLYTWTVLGGTIVSGQGSNSIHVNWGTTLAGTVTVFETNNSCTGTNVLPIVINSGTHTLSGYVHYDNVYLIPLNGVNVQLVNNSGSVIATASTGYDTLANGGYYEFNNIAYGNYSLNVSSNKLWGGVNATDALIVQLNIGGGSLSPFRQIAADVNNSSTITALDALFIDMRVVGMTSSFAAGDWKFNNSIFTFDPTHPTYSFSGICVGDLNGSYIPTGLKETALTSIIDGNINIPINESFTYNIKSTQSANLGALTLFMNYDQNRFEIEKVNSKLDGLQYVINDGQISLAWADSRAISLNNNDIIISLQMKAKSAINEPSQIFTIKSNSEFADLNANKLNDFTVKMANISTSSNNSTEIIVSNYPNPFTSETEIVYTLPEQGNVKLILSNVLGQTISSLVDGIQSAGSYKVIVNSSKLKLTPGVYTYRIEVEGVTNTYSRTNKIIYK